MKEGERCILVQWGRAWQGIKPKGRNQDHREVGEKDSEREQELGSKCGTLSL